MELHLAPLRNISCWAFRASAAGATDSYTEMIPLKPLLKSELETMNKVDTFPIEGQHQWLQVLTHNIEEMRQAPRLIQDFMVKYPDRLAIYGVNLNMGCPDPDVIAEGNGAALLKRPGRVRDLIAAFLGEPNSHNIHFSIKLRIGFTEHDMIARKFLEILEIIQSFKDPRTAPPILHFKFARQSSESQPHWELLEPVLETNIPLIINGGFTAPTDYERVISWLSSDIKPKAKELIKGLMIGRAAAQNLDCFIPFSLNQPINNSQNPKPRPIADKKANWGDRLLQNLEIHPPTDRFLNGFKKFYPTIFQTNS